MATKSGKKDFSRSGRVAKLLACPQLSEEALLRAHDAVKAQKLKALVVKIDLVGPSYFVIDSGGEERSLSDWYLEDRLRGKETRERERFTSLLKRIGQYRTDHPEEIPEKYVPADPSQVDEFFRDPVSQGFRTFLQREREAAKAATAAAPQAGSHPRKEKGSKAEEKT